MRMRGFAHDGKMLCRNGICGAGGGEMAAGSTVLIGTPLSLSSVNFEANNKQKAATIVEGGPNVKTVLSFFKKSFRLWVVG